MRTIIGPKGGEVQGNRRKLQKEELLDRYASLNIIQVMETRMRCVGDVAWVGDNKNAHRVLVRKHGGQVEDHT
jgi:hypothetical protein